MKSGMTDALKDVVAYIFASYLFHRDFLAFRDAAGGGSLVLGKKGFPSAEHAGT